MAVGNDYIFLEMWMVDMLEDHLAALILSKIVRWYTTMDKRGKTQFYKAIRPEGADKPGDSWCEEVRCSIHQFERCRSLFSTKSDHPLSILTEKYDAEGELLPPSHIVMSYNDKNDNNRIYWTVNLPLLYHYKMLFNGGITRVEDIDTDTFRLPPPAKTMIDTQQKPESIPTKNHNPITIHTTTDNNNIEIRDALAVAIAEVHLGLRSDERWSVHVAADIDQYQAILEQIGIEAREVYGFREWYEKTVGVKNLPVNKVKFASHYRTYKKHLDEVRDAVTREEREQAEREARRQNLQIS